MADGICSVDGCGRTGRVILGWCVGHYERVKKYGDAGDPYIKPARVKIPAGTTCLVETCVRPAHCRGWCKSHYSRWERHGDVQAGAPIGPAAQDKVRGVCTLDECERPLRANGFCSEHDGRNRRHGDPRGGKPIGQLRRGICKVEDCSDPHYIRGHCVRHHYRVERYGSVHGGRWELDPLIVASRGKTPEDRFWERVDTEGPVPPSRPDLGNCWLWLLSHNGAGYGQTFLFPDIGMGTHRVAWHLSGFPLVPGMQLDHLCRNEGCLRPSHLEQVTPAINNLRSNSWAGLNHRKTRCSKGHPYNLINTGWTKQGHRKCLVCVNGKAERAAALAALSPRDRLISRSYRKAIAGDLCRFCSQPAAEVDHYFPISKGGGEMWFNLGPSCVPCNRSKGPRCGTWFALKRGLAKQQQS